jgi:hypothetical protein
MVEARSVNTSITSAKAQLHLPYSTSKANTVLILQLISYTNR